MLTIQILAVGKLKEAYLRDACAEYQKRLTPFAKLEVIELSEYRLSADPSEAEIAAGLAAEGEAMFGRLRRGNYMIPMCIEGKELSSTSFAELIDRVCLDGKSGISFCIGGSYGLSDAVKQSGDFSLSMSKMTFPHQLARVLLLEQLYRACMIRANGKYHK